MTLNVYVDAFNLYYGCLMDTPYKWLNLRVLCELLFSADPVKDIHYFTARIKPNPHDPDQHVRQDTYFRRKAIGMRGGKPPLIIQDAHLGASQFPPTIADAHGIFHKPAAW